MRIRYSIWVEQIAKPNLRKIVTKTIVDVRVTYKGTCVQSSVGYVYKLFQLSARLYGLGYPRQAFPRVTLAEVTFSLFLCKIQPTVYIRIVNPSRGARQLGWASCLASAGKVTPASETTVLHINALARLTGTSLGVASDTYCLDLGFKAEIHIKEVKINSAKPTVIEWSRETPKKRDICTFDYSIRVMNNHAGSTLTRPAGKLFSRIKAR